MGEQPKVSMAKQIMVVATNVATWVTITILAFVGATLLSLDKSSGIMSSQMKTGFEVMAEKLDRIEVKQGENSKMIASHGSRLSAIEANRFTDGDSRELLQTFAASVAGMDEKIQEIWKAIGSMRATIPAEMVRKLEEDMRVMQAQADKLRERVADHDHK